MCPPLPSSLPPCKHIYQNHTSAKQSQYCLEEMGCCVGRKGAVHAGRRTELQVCEKWTINIFVADEAV